MYEHVDVNVSQPDGLDDFIAWDLQGLYCHFEVAESPAAVASKSSVKVRKVIQFISSNAEGNITIAKLYLDSIYRLQSLDDAVRVGDRLPRNLVALFDAGIEQIKQRPRAESEIALMAIGAASEIAKGIPLALLDSGCETQLLDYHTSQTLLRAVLGMFSGPQTDSSWS